MTTEFQSPLRRAPTPFRRLDIDDRGFLGAFRDAVMLDTSLGQEVMFRATANAFDVHTSSAYRRVAPGYNAYEHDDLTGFENYLGEFRYSTSPEETAMIKQMIENNLDLRHNLEDYGITRFAAGLVDPVNFIPVPMALGRGFWGGVKAAAPIGGLSIAATELARHERDPTSTWSETAMATLAGTLFVGLIGGAVGRFSPIGKTPASAVLDKLVPIDKPVRGTAQMFAGLPWWMGKTNKVFGRVLDRWRSAAGYGEPRSTSIPKEKFEAEAVTLEDGVEGVNIRYEDVGNVVQAERRGKTLMVYWTELPESLRGQGIATAAYRQLIEFAESRGLRVTSDEVTNKFAQRIWDRLEDEGFNIHRNDDFQLDHTGTKTSNDGNPNYQVRRLVDDAESQVPREIRDELADMKNIRDALHVKRGEVDAKIKAAKRALKTATKKGGWKTKRKNALRALQEERRLLEHHNIRRIESRIADMESKMAMMLDEKAIKDWDLLPTGYNKLLGKLDQFPWWTLMKTPLRTLAPEIATKLQLYALRMGATPGLNTRGHRLGHTAGPSVEALSYLHTGRWLAAKKASDKLYAQYLDYGSDLTQFRSFVIDSGQRVRSKLDQWSGKEPTGRNREGKYTIQEWERQITIAIANGGNHGEEMIRQAAANYMRALQQVADEARELGIFASQRNIRQRIERIEAQIAKNEKALEKMDNVAERVSMRIHLDDLELNRAYLEGLEDAYKNADSASMGETGYVHRMWLADEVKAKEAELKEYITKRFTENPKEGKVTVRIDDETVVIDLTDPEAIAARVDEAYASILREATVGGDAEFTMKSTDKRDWLEARLEKLKNPDTLESIEHVLRLSPERRALQIEIIERKLKRIKNNESITGGSGPLLSRRLDLDDRVLLEMGVIESNVNHWVNHYVSRMGPQIETARVFGDHRAMQYIEDVVTEINTRALNETDPKIRKQLLEEADRAYTAMSDLRDIVHGVYQIPDDPSSLTARTLRLLRNFNILGAMGRSVYMAFGDTGNVIVSQGFTRVFRHGWESLASGMTSGKIKMMRDEVELAGSVSEVVLGMRYQQLTELGPQTGAMTKFERGVSGAAQRFFVLNLLGPWTDMMRRFSGGMLQSRLIENSILWRSNDLPASEVQVMTRLGISRQQAVQFANEWEASGSLKHKNMFIAQTEQWASDEARRVFRAALNTEIGRMVPTPGAVDKPKALLKSEWWKVVGQYRGFSIGATHRIMSAGLQTEGASKWAGMMSMVAIAGMVDMWKRPDYIQMPIEEQMLRAVELSAVTGIILDLNDTIERASAGAVGLRTALGMDIRERNPNWANRIGTIGAVPNQWLTLMYALTSDEAETSDLARAVRYMIPYNNLLYWNEAFNRAQRSFVDFVEEEDND